MTFELTETPAAPGPRLADAAVPIAPAALNNLYDHAFDVLLHERVAALDGLFSLDGGLGRLTKLSGGVFYGVTLTDAQGKATLINVRVGMVAECDEGAFVRVVGRVRRSRFKHQFQFSLDALEITRIGQAAPAARSAVPGAQHLRDLQSRRYPFPFARRLCIVAICGKDNQVFADFREQLEPLGDLVDLVVRETRMGDAAAIAAEIERANADVIALLRGGGNEQDMSVFDALPVLEAMAAKTAFRLVGIGHSKDRHLLDRIVDHATATPTEAGRFVRDQMEALSRFEQDRRRESQGQINRRLREALLPIERARQEAERALHDTRSKLAHVDELVRASLQASTRDPVTIDTLHRQVRSLRIQRGLIGILCGMLAMALAFVSGLTSPGPKPTVETATPTVSPFPAVPSVPTNSLSPRGDPAGSRVPLRRTSRPRAGAGRSEAGASQGT